MPRLTHLLPESKFTMPPRQSKSPTRSTAPSYHHRLELVDRQHDHDKFWEVELKSGTITYRWGRRGTVGQSKSEDASDKALQAASKLLDKKLKNGYRDVSAADADLVGQLLTAKERATLDNLCLGSYRWVKATLLPRYAVCASWLWLAATFLTPPSPSGTIWLLPSLAVLALGAVRVMLLSDTEVVEALASIAHGACQALIFSSYFMSLAPPSWLSPVPLLLSTRAAVHSVLPQMEAPAIAISALLLLLEAAPLLLLSMPLGPIGCLLDFRLLRLADSKPPSLPMRLTWLTAHVMSTALLPVTPLFFGDKLLRTIDEACGVALVEREAWIAARVYNTYTMWMSGSVPPTSHYRPSSRTVVVAHQPRRHRTVDLGCILPSEYDQPPYGTLEARQRRHDRRLHRALFRWGRHCADSRLTWGQVVPWVRREAGRLVVPTYWRVRVQLSPGNKLV